MKTETSPTKAGMSRGKSLVLWWLLWMVLSGLEFVLRSLREWVEQNKLLPEDDDNDDDDDDDEEDL